MAAAGPALGVRDSVYKSRKCFCIPCALSFPFRSEPGAAHIPFTMCRSQGQVPPVRRSRAARNRLPLTRFGRVRPSLARVPLPIWREPFSKRFPMLELRHVQSLPDVCQLVRCWTKLALEVKESLERPDCCSRGHCPMFGQSLLTHRQHFGPKVDQVRSTHSAHMLAKPCPTLASNSGHHISPQIGVKLAPSLAQIDKRSGRASGLKQERGMWAATVGAAGSKRFWIRSESKVTHNRNFEKS